MTEQRKDQMTGATGQRERTVSTGMIALNVGTTGIIATTVATETVAVTETVAATEIAATTVAIEITAVTGAITGETKKKTGIKRENSDRTTDRREAIFHPETVPIGPSALTTRASGLTTAAGLRRTRAEASSRRCSTRSCRSRCHLRRRTLPPTP